MNLESLKPVIAVIVNRAANKGITAEELIADMNTNPREFVRKLFELDAKLAANLLATL